MTESPQAPSLLAIYRELLELSVRQREALEEADDAGFEASSQAREGVFARLRARDGELARLPGAERREADTLIGRILEHDDALERLIRARSAAIQDELRGLHTGLNALHSYAQAMDPSAVFIDRSS
jgi:hypothetical protein